MDHQKKSNFAATCNLLSQYIKEKKGFNLKNMSHGYSSPVLVDDDDKGSTDKTPRTMNFFPGADASTSPEPKSTFKNEDPVTSKLTIFYDGKVVVIDNFPKEKVKEFMMVIAGKSTSTPDKPKADEPLPTSSDLPIARRASLSKFLERRKDRVISRAPYQVNPSSSSADHQFSKEKTPAWLGLAPSNHELHQQQ